MNLAETATPSDIEIALRRLYAQREAARAAYHANVEERRARMRAWYHDPVRHEERKTKNREAMRARAAAKKESRERLGASTAAASTPA